MKEKVLNAGLVTLFTLNLGKCVTTVVYYNLSSEFCIGLICSIVTKDQSLRNFKL